MIQIFKGDDTGGTFGREIGIKIELSEVLPLDGCRAEFELLGIVKRIPAPLENGRVYKVFFSHNETQKFPIGRYLAKLRIIDAAGKIRTLDNTIRVEVTDDISKVYQQGGGFTVTAGGAVDWSLISGKPEIYTKGEVDALLADVETGGGAPADHTHTAAEVGALPLVVTETVSINVKKEGTLTVGAMEFFSPEGPAEFEVGFPNGIGVSKICDYCGTVQIETVENENEDNPSESSKYNFPRGLLVRGNDLEATLSNKAEANHTHTAADIEGLSELVPQGVNLTAPNGTRYALGVNNDGTLYTYIPEE